MAFPFEIDPATTVLAGITWDVAEKGMGRAEARTRARSAGAQAFILRAEDRNLGSAALPGKPAAWRDKRFVSLVAALADIGPSEPWCGVFEFGSRFAFVATTDGRIVQPDGDKVFEREQDARARFEQERELVAVAYAPPSWAIDQALDADALLAQVDWAQASAMQVAGAGSTKRPAIVLLAGAALLAAAFAGWQYWRTMEMERAAEQAAIKSPPPPPNPWIAKGKPYAAVSACLEVRGRLADYAHNGWAIEKLECDADGGKYSATLTSFSANSVLPGVEPGATVKLKEDGTGILIDGRLSSPRGRDRSAEHASTPNVLAVRNFIASSVDQFAWQGSSNRSQFSMKIAANLAEVAARIDKFDTVSINRLEYSGGKWRVDGEVFN